MTVRIFAFAALLFWSSVGMAAEPDSASEPKSADVADVAGVADPAEEPESPDDDTEALQPTFEPLETPPAEPSRRAGFLRDDDLRYPNTNAFVRLLADIPAIPASVVTWGWSDWALFAGVMGTVGTLMWPTDPPPDVRFNRWATPKDDPLLPEIWAMKYQIPFWTALATSLVTTWGVAWLRDDEEMKESMSLVAESVAVGQVYHLSLKLAFGRDGSGNLKSFPESLELFPQGTPSGHFTTLYAIYGSLEAYWQPHWAVRVGMHTLLASMWITHMLNNKHYLSEQIFGAALGYSVAYWVVRHRSSRYRYSEDGSPLRIGAMPVRGGAGLAIGGDW